jgi:predicted nucleic acid-binding Zn ribbon protein
MLAKAVGRKEIFDRLEANRVIRHWMQVVGPHLAAKSTPEKFERGVLTVAVTSAPWAQELRLRKAELVIRLNDAAGKGLFEDIKFVARSAASSPSIDPQTDESFEPMQVDVEVSIPEIAEVVKRALGRMKSASNRKK